MRAIHVIALSILFCCSTQMSFAQEDTTKHEIVVVKLTNGLVRIGYIESDDGREILLISEDVGKIYIDKNQIISIKPNVEGEEVIQPDPALPDSIPAMDTTVMIEKDSVIPPLADSLRYIGAFPSKYFVTHNMLPMKKGDAYVNIGMMGIEAQFTVAKNLTFGVWSFLSASPLTDSTRYTFETEKPTFNFGLINRFGSSGYFNNFRGYGGTHLAAMTLGTSKKNMTIGGGFSYIHLGSVGEEYEELGQYLGDSSKLQGLPDLPFVSRVPNLITAPTLTISGTYRTKGTAQFIFESVFFFSTQKDEIRNIEHQFNADQSFAELTTVTAGDKSTFSFLLTPSIRLQRKPNRAFQATIGAFTVIDLQTQEFFAVPTPILSWYMGF